MNRSDRLIRVRHALKGVLAVAGLLAAGAAWAQSIEKVAPALASALARQQDAETLASLSAEGQVLYARERVKLDGYQYCSQAVSLAEKGELRESIRAASKALHLGLEGGNDDLVAVSKRDLAIAYSYAGNLERAEQYAREAMTHQAANNAIVAGPALKVLGDVQARRGKFKEAIAFYEQAEKASSDKFRPLVEISLANAYVAAGDVAAARARYDKLPVPEKAALRATYRRGQGQLLLAEGKPQEALAVFNTALSDASGSDADYQRLWAQEGIGRSQLALGDKAAAGAAYAAAVGLSEGARARFRSEEFKTGLFGDTQAIFEQAVALAMERGDAVSAFEISEKGRARALLDIVRDRVDLKAQSTSARSAKAIQAALLPNEALVEYHSLADKLIAWVVTRDALTGSTLPIAREALASRVDQFRQAILERKPAALTQGEALHATLIAPLNLPAGARLAFVPHGPLHYLPFQALRADGRYLIQAHPIAIAPSGSVAVNLLERPQEGPRKLTAFGNPEIEPRFALPGSQREVEQLALLFPLKSVFLKAEASKSRFKQVAGEGRILHVAAHAEVDAVDPLYSRILLAREGDEANFLEAREVFDLDLKRVSLVTLSACESGLGRIARGDEILGFTRSFLSAGASSLIVSLWPVADDSTELLMTTLYRDLSRGADLQQAMQSAQLAVLNKPSFAHPFFWAPFNLMGDWRQKFPG